MLQADIIREHALKRYVEAARRAHQETVTIVAGKVGRDLGLSNWMRNICQALKGRKFREMAGVRWLNPKEYGDQAIAEAPGVRDPSVDGG